MKRISALFTSFLITILVMLLPYVVMAATPVNVSVSKNEVKPGDTVTVIVGANVKLSFTPSDPYFANCRQLLIGDMPE